MLAQPEAECNERDIEWTLWKHAKHILYVSIRIRH